MIALRPLRLWMFSGLLLTGCGEFEQTSTPGTLPSFEEGDVGLLVENAESFVVMNDTFMAFLPGGAIPEMEGEDCILLDPEEPEVDGEGSFDFDIIFNDCPIGGDESQILIDGTASINGSSDPGSAEFEDLINTCSDFIDGFENLLTDQGTPSYLLDVGADYGFSTGNETTLVLDSSMSVLAYDEAWVLSGELTFPFESEEGQAYLATVTQHLFFDLTDENFKTRPTGALIVIVKRPGHSATIATMNFDFDGTQIASFDITVGVGETPTKTGSINTETGDVDFDPSET